MELRQFKHSYHDAWLVRFTVGPRREIALEIALNAVWNEGLGVAHVRFGGIKNLDSVTAFLERLPARPAPHAYLAEIMELTLKVGRSRTAILELDPIGRIEVEAVLIEEA
jgi:hypothetical protein